MRGKGATKSAETRRPLTELFPLGPRPSVMDPHARVSWDLRFRDVWPEVRREAAKRVLEGFQALDELDRQIEELRDQRAAWRR
jgi:hypothetical protein